MIGVLEIAHAPVEPRAKAVLQMRRPARERIVTIGRSVPRIALVGPIVRMARIILVQAVASRPTAPGWLIGIVHARRDEIKERHRVTLLLPMGGVGRIHRAERAMTRENVARQIESA